MINDLCTTLISKGIEAYNNVMMSEYTTFRIGGAAKLLALPKNESELVCCVQCAREKNVNYYVIGNGSDLLVSDSGIDGFVICTKNMESAIKFDSENERVTCSAGVLLPALVSKVIENGYMGMEWACGIPGTVGGAIAMNAGAHGGEMKNILYSVRILTADGSVKTVTPQEGEMGYRKSRYSFPDAIVLSATFLLQRDDGNAMDRRKELLKTRREHQPTSYPSAGSTFLRPEGAFAGKLIEDAGLKGTSIGGAQVSSLHAGFIINTGGATCEDVLALIMQVKDTVFKNSGIMLKEEIKIIGQEQGIVPKRGE